jgi:short-subunit dehydrogenase
MRARRSGLIVNVSSILGMLPMFYYFSPYVTSKHAIEGFTEMLRGEVKPFGIKVASVQPAIMDTKIEKTIDEPDHPIADYAPYRQRAYDMENYALQHGRDPNDVAQAILHVIRNPDPPMRTGAGKEARLLLPLLRPVPHRGTELVMQWLFLSRKPWHPEQEPVRRLFIDPRYADRVQQRWTLAMLLIVPILFFINWFRRSE